LLTVKVSPTGAGTIKIEYYANTTWNIEEFEVYPATFTCFQYNAKLRFTAQALSGYKFKKWQGNDWDSDGDLDLPSGFTSNPDEFYHIHDGTLITAVFEKIVNPTVNAGADRETEINTSVTLQGSVSNPGNLPLNYQWTQESGISVKNFSDQTTLTPSFITPATKTTLIFMLKAIDKNTSVVYGSDDITIEVKIPEHETQRWYKDKDGDKYSDGTSLEAVDRPSKNYFLISELTAASGDCNDNNALIHPGASEICGDGIDQDCNGNDISCNDPPSAPSGLASNAVSYKKIILKWTDKSSNEDGFIIERKKRGCNSLEQWNEIANGSKNINTYNDLDIEPESQYSYRVKAYNGIGDSEYSNCNTTKTSSYGSPGAPVNFDVTYSSSSKVKLSWNEGSSKVTKFEIYRKVGSGSWSLYAITAPDVLNYMDKTAPGNQTTTSYCYYVQACNDAGCSPPTYAACLPFNPTSLSATPGSNGKISLLWTDMSDNERGFEIYRKAGNCSSSSSWELIKTAGINRTSITDSNIESGKTYSYKIRAYSRSWGLPYAYGHSNWSNCVSAKAP
jgi:hypothetical protein